ncbi:MAG TPA: two-component regulator propeller domain-containing protein [Cytophagales bacterium]|nr:two-component regulator propeller domain-containing protein [Cytophagales bacterium]
MKFEKLGIDEGLSQSNVSSLLQDRKGFMWFGTKDGLNKYDGYRFTVYKKSLEDKNSLSSNDIKSLLEDAAGNIWIATWQGGLNRFDPKKERFTHYRNNPNNPRSLASEDIKCLYYDRDGNLWIGTGNEGLDLFDKTSGSFIHFVNDKNDPNSIGDNGITCLFEDKDHNLWIGTRNGGLNLFDKKTETFKGFQHDPYDNTTLSHNNVQFIHEDDTGNLWIGTYGGGLNLFDKRKGTFTRIHFKEGNGDKSKNYSVLLSIAEDNTGNYWIGTENSGVISFDPEKMDFSYYRSLNDDQTSISSNTITSILKDTKGNLWFGTSDGGINRINVDGTKFNHYRHQQNLNSLSNNIVACIYEDSRENIWIGTDGGGLNLFDKKKKSFTHFRHEKDNAQSICGDNVLTVCEDSLNNLWVGTWGQGISVFNPIQKKYKHYRHDPKDSASLSNDFAFRVFKDSKNRIWVATYGGGLNLYFPEEDSFLKYSHDEKDKGSISSNFLLTIFEDKNGRIWIGTDGSGLNLFDEENNKFISYTQEDSEYGLSNNYVGCILEDKDGFIWLSTNFGLNKLNPRTNKITKFFVKDGLPNDVITGTLQDAKGNLWISTSKGLSQFDPKNNIFKNYSTSDGLQANEFKSSCLSKDGRMYFGGRNGFNEFWPDSIKGLDFDPPIVFTNFEIFNKQVPITQGAMDVSPLQENITDTREINLTYKQSVISFEFATLNFTTPEKKRYSYILEGFDDHWRDIGTRNTVTYTNLDPGIYTLKVKGLTNNGTWSEKRAEMKITISPPFWKTWWFKLLAVLAVAGLLLIAFYSRLAAIRRQNILLEKEVTKRTHELSDANFSLHERNEEIKLQNETLEEFNREIKRQSDKILNQQDHIVHQNEELEKTVTELASINQTKDKFFSILAHDLKNPVAALSGISDLLMRKLEKLNKEEVYNHVNNINKSSNAVYNLLINLLDWARTQTKNIPCNPAKINVYQMILQNFSLMEQQMRSKDIGFRMKVDERLAIFADQQMVDTVFRNILSNSIKFTPPFGEVVVESAETESGVNIIIRDSGIGMTEVQLENLFKIEKQNFSKGTEGEDGTGLGLIISKEFIELNKGTLSVSSKSGKGSSFTIQLPKANNTSTSGTDDLTLITTNHTPDNLVSVTQLSAEQISKVKGRHVLIVDDNKEIRAFLKLLLSEVFEISEAGNGIEGIKAAREFQPEVIISDMIMPEMDGLQFCEKIKGSVDTSHIPVILLTSQKNEEDQLSGYQAGADVYLTKPIQQQILFQVILNTLNNQEKIRKRVAQSDYGIPEDLGINKLDEEFLNKVVEFIEQNLSDPLLDHKKVCQFTALSRTLLYAKFKSLTGQGVHDFIKTIRIKKGLKLLLEGRMNINQVAYEVGFSTPSYFSKSFIKQYGMPPRDYIAYLKQKHRN